LKRIRQGRSARGLAACFLIALAAAWSNASCTKAAPTSVLAAPADSKEVFSEVGPFELVDRGGSTVTRETLLGHPWVASFLFTRCTGPCPKVVGTLRRLQARLERQAAHIVTFSVDPQFDTPEVLRSYAADAGADPKRWLFLTGDEKAIDALIQKSFLCAVARAPAGEAPVGEAVSHRTQLVAVDRKGKIRGYYAGETDAELDLLVARLAFLENERE
jgi:cytochrome oxidase Cu insertion factor (SCO1/SenC/PrrC family)